MGERLAALASDPDCRARMGRAGWARAKSHFTWGAGAGRIAASSGSACRPFPGVTSQQKINSLMPLETPVAFIIFNRPETTQRVFAEIRHAQPKMLFVIADGPRSAEEAEKCRQARGIIGQVDWECDVRLNFSETNLGCKLRVSSGLDWVFTLCEEAIILEDDCLPHPTFFPYCEELLAKYRGDERVMAIAGSNLLVRQTRGSDSYYFSQLPYIWGWATWRRAWNTFDLHLTDWPARRKSGWLKMLPLKEARAQWQRDFDAGLPGSSDTHLKNAWGFRWIFAVWNKGGLSIVPNENLITNIGFGEGATHTPDAGSINANIPAAAMTFPLRHPKAVKVDAKTNVRAWRRAMASETGPRPSLPRRIRRKLGALVRKWRGRNG